MWWKGGSEIFRSIGVEASGGVDTPESLKEVRDHWGGNGEIIEYYGLGDIYRTSVTANGMVNGIQRWGVESQGNGGDETC